MLHDPVADHDRLIARVNSHVDMQAEGDQSAGGLLEQVDQSVIAFVGGDRLVLPEGERVGRAPEEQEVVTRGGFPHHAEFRLEVSAGPRRRPGRPWY